MYLKMYMSVLSFPQPLWKKGVNLWKSVIFCLCICVFNVSESLH